MLKIDCNQLKELPASFCDLQNLTEVFMGRNKIFELPDKIGNLKELIFLDVDYNSLTRLPNSVKYIINRFANVQNSPFFL